MEQELLIKFHVVHLCMCMYVCNTFFLIIYNNKKTLRELNEIEFHYKGKTRL